MSRRLFLLVSLLFACACSFSVSPAARMTATAATSASPAALVMLAKKKKGGGGGAAGGMVQVVLFQPVKGIGKKGEIVKVKSAYAENVILRGGLGEMATEEKLEEIAVAEAAAAATAKAEKDAAIKHSEKIESVFGEDGAAIKKNAGPDGKLFGSVTATELVSVLQEQAGVTVKSSDIKPPDMKSVGEGFAEVRLHKEVVAKLKVVVSPAGSVLK